MKLQLTLLSKWLLFLGQFGAMVGGLIVIVFLMSDGELVGAEVAQEEIFYCGTSDFPSSIASQVEHPGRIVFEENCQICHSTDKGILKVGPSLCGATKRMPPKVMRLLFAKDPGNLLSKQKYYRKLKKENADMGIHETMKFGFSDNQLNRLKGYMDTITVIQE